MIKHLIRYNHIKPINLFKRTFVNDKLIKSSKYNDNIITYFHHIKLFVGSAKSTCDMFINKFDFFIEGYSGPETGNNETKEFLLTYGNAKIIIASPLGNKTNYQKTMNNLLSKHGDGVGDIAFVTNNIDALQLNMNNNNAIVTNDLRKYDDYKMITYRAHMSHSNLTHSFIEFNKNISYDIMLPFFKEKYNGNKYYKNYRNIDIDHIVINMRENEMIPTTKWYEKCLGFKRFWSVDDKQIHTDYSSLKSVVMTNESETIKMPINEPAPGKKEGQIQEFINENDGPGVQHIALRVPNIIDYVSGAKSRGLQFLKPPPDAYYDEILKKLELNNIKIKENFNTLRNLGILIDCDEEGYLLQIFTESIVDRPTLFFEIIQRCSNDGFGAGNFKTLFELIENDQEKRGNLKPYKKPKRIFPDILSLHHFSYKCKNINETIDFYCNILNLPYIHKIENDYVSSTGEYQPYKHIFFQLKDGSCIAFFDLYDNKIKNNSPDWINHIAFNVDSLVDLNIAKYKLIENLIEVLGPIKQDDFITSIYFKDPNGLRIELTYQNASLQTLENNLNEVNSDKNILNYYNYYNN